MDDKKFEIIDDKGNKIQCEIIKLVPNDEDSEKPYIIFTDFEEILCGKLIEKDGIYTVNKITEDYIVDYLKEQLSDEIIKELERYKELTNNE